MPVCVIPYKPRAPQRVLHAMWESHRFSVCVAHRRMGKTVAAVNHLIKAALLCTQKNPRCAYIAPTFTQGKQTAWTYIQDFARAIDGTHFNQSELRADFVTGA